MISGLLSSNKSLLKIAIFRSNNVNIKIFISLGTIQSMNNLKEMQNF